MSGFSRSTEERATLAGAPLGALVDAAAVGTPTYVYDLDAIQQEARAMVDALGDARHTVAYAIKANSAGSIVRTVAAAGGGAEVLSRGELEVALGAGVPPGRIMTTSVAKADHEIDAAIAANIRAIAMESVEELPRVAERARALGAVARVVLRINPAVSIDAHPYVATGHDKAKFGIALGDLAAAWERADRYPSLDVVGVGAHVGSTLKQIEPYLASARVVCDVARARLRAGKQLEL